MGPSQQKTGDVAAKFILASVAWLAVGLLFAGYFVLDNLASGALPLGVSIQLKFLHAHTMLIGFVGMLIFGVAYRMLPLPPLLGTGGLYSVRLAEYHLWIGNAALVAMLLAGLGSALGLPFSAPALRLFSLVEVLVTFLFVYNIYRTVRLRETELPFGGGEGGGPSGQGPGA